MKCRNLSELLAGCLALVIALSTLSVRAEGSGPAPAPAFAQLEARLLAADSVSLDFHITAEGALGADLQGKLRVSTTTPRPFNMLLSVWGDFSADPEDPAAFSFAITVAGTPAATARLQLDDAGLPRLRQQTVVFPGGEMRVTERYSAVAIED